MHIGFAITDIQHIRIVEDQTNFAFNSAKKPGSTKKVGRLQLKKSRLLVREEIGFNNITKGVAWLKVNKIKKKYLDDFGPHEKLLLSLFVGSESI